MPAAGHLHRRFGVPVRPKGALRAWSTSPSPSPANVLHAHHALNAEQPLRKDERRYTRRDPAQAGANTGSSRRKVPVSASISTRPPTGTMNCSRMWPIIAPR